MKRLNCALIVGLLASPAVAADGKAVHDAVCYKCHRTGVDDAPKTGNKEHWAPRLTQGLPALYQAVLEGKGAMDPRAGREELTDEELKAGVDYLVGLVK
ncbi:MAG: cytochrome c-type protein [Rhodocyclaceae bacterium]|nr:MAG: cytochrome c-type protein [Rhodocyclaceae bacterium]TND03109.1 MAG: cytochrome c-type protein [Rhodocyclaceae bacterium]